MTNKKKRTIAIALILAMAVLLSACTSSGGESDPATGDDEVFEIVVAQSADAQTLDPQEAGGTYGANPVYNIFDHLVFYDREGVLKGQIATDWYQEDEYTWVFNLRDDVTFHNGEICNAEAFCYTLDRMFEEGSGRTTYSMSSLVSWEARDEFVLVLKTEEPDLTLPNKLVDLIPLPPKYTEEVGKEHFGTHPIGTGPYKFVDWKSEESITLEVYEDYYGDRPEVDRLVFVPIPEASTRIAELIAGNVDIILDVNPEYIPMIEQNDHIRVVSQLGKRVPWVGINQLEWADQYEVLSNKLVRQALNYAVDVDAICESILGGYSKPIANLWRADHDGYDPSIKPYPYDPEKAKDLLAKAGYPDGFKVKLITSPAVILQGLEVGQAIASYLEDVGITVDLESLELNTFRSIVIGAQDQQLNADLYISNWGTKPTEIGSCLNGIVVSGGITNYYHNPEMDELISAALGAKTVEERNEQLAQVQQLLMEEAPFIFLYQQGDLYGISNRIDWTPRLDQYVLGDEIKRTE